MAKKIVRRKKTREYDWRKLAIVPAWVFVAYIVSNVIVAALLWVLDYINLSPEATLRPNVFQMLVAASVYILSILIAAGVPYKLMRREKTTLKDVGLDRLMTWTDIGLAPLAFIAYLLTLTTVLGIVAFLFPSFPSDQSQNIGFNLFGSQLDNMVAFLTLVALAPFAEEVLFRGYLYGKLKKYVPGFWAAVATSALFGLVHFQWNVAIDVFVLSMFLCGLRSLTGSIWAGILAHALKNALAYLILLNPLFFGG